jgi:hypothetical protein
MKVHSIFAHPYANRRNAVIWPEMPKSTGIHPIHVRPQILKREKEIHDSDDCNHHEAPIMPPEGFNNCPDIRAYAVSVF